MGDDGTPDPGADERWRLSETFDLVSHAYGWTDEQILELTPKRLRLIQEAIGERLLDDRRYQAHLAERHARAVAQGFRTMVGKKEAAAFDRWVDSIKFWRTPESGDEIVDGTYRGRPLPPAELLLGEHKK